jgi:ketosteroid isomerase-like protein
MRVENRSRTGFPDRSASDLRASFAELNAMVASTRTWPSAVCWLSPAWNVTRLERKGVGADGEQYEWTRLLVNEFRDGLVMFACEFEPEDEAAAFAYAEERVRPTSSRLAVTNRTTEIVEAGWLAIRAQDVDAFVALYSDRFEYDDRRRLGGNPVRGSVELRVAFERVLQQYSHFDQRHLAVRGDHLELHSSRWSDDVGNETAFLHVVEIGDDGRIIYDGRFDEDDFEGAYRELERRYYTGEGAAFVAGGATVTEYAIALNRSEFDRAFGELSGPDFRLENRSRSGFGDRSAAELHATYEDLTVIVASARIWHSALCWLTPAYAVGRFERDAVGLDGERYAWTLIDVAEIRDGQIAFACQFELEDEEAAFAYAQERIRLSE